jgi:hypothetical protein
MDTHTVIYNVTDYRTLETIIADCLKTTGWSPEAVREVEAEYEWLVAFRCFRYNADAELWDNLR